MKFVLLFVFLSDLCKDYGSLCQLLINHSWTSEALLMINVWFSGAWPLTRHPRLFFFFLFFYFPYLLCLYTFFYHWWWCVSFIYIFLSLSLLVSFYWVYPCLNEECALKPVQERAHSERASRTSLRPLNAIKALVLSVLSLFVFSFAFCSVQNPTPAFISVQSVSMCVL